MNLEINGKDKELKFDIGFIRKMDNLHAMENKQAGLKFGAGLLVANAQLAQYNVPILSDIIYCATKGVKQADVDEAIGEVAEKEGNLDSLFNDIQEAMGKSPILATTIKNLKNKAKKAQQENEV